jgi:hypothetical protein
MASEESHYFKSSINIWTEIIIWGTILFMTASILFLADTNKSDLFWVGIIHIALIVLFLWIRYQTYYILTSYYLWYRSGPVRGKIALKNISKIKLHQGIVIKSFLKPALGYDGFYLYYNKFDDIYISPVDKEKFINKLMESNPNIINLD